MNGRELLKSFPSRILIMFVAAALLFAPLVSGYTMMGQMTMMAGGRSLKEKDLSQKQMFRDLRNKFNEAAKAPTFFETAGSHVVSIFSFYCITSSRLKFKSFLSRILNCTARVIKMAHRLATAPLLSSSR